LNPLISEAGDCTPKSDVLGWVFSCEEGDLDNGDVERIGLLVKSYFERSPHSVIETTAHGVGPDSSSIESIHDFLGYFWELLLR
jgi:hypothetical protein